MLRDYAMAYNQISESMASLLRVQCFMCDAVYCSVLQQVVHGEYYAIAYALQDDAVDLRTRLALFELIRQVP